MRTGLTVTCWDPSGRAISQPPSHSSSCDEFQTGFYSLSTFPPPKAYFWTPFIPPSLTFFPCVPSPHIINTPQLTTPPKHTHTHIPTLHPLSTPLEPLTSKACQLNMSLIRAVVACSLGWGMAFLQLSITTSESHRLSDNQRKHSDLIHISILACSGLLFSLLHNTHDILLLFNYQS